MKNITLVASASVALVKLANLIAQLKARNFNVNVIATPRAIEYFDDLKNMITIDINKNLKENTEHIFLAKNTDLFVVVPATANTIAKFVAGYGDNIALSTLLAADQKILFVPAMNDKMLEGTIKRNHLKWLEDNGHFIIGPNYGMLAEGYQGWGRMSEIDEIVEAIENITLSPLKKSILVSYGASKEYIDPIRYITNNSSGKFGKLIIKNLKLMGFNVKAINVANVSHKDIYNLAKNYDIYVAVGAISNFKFNKQESKIKKDQEFNLKAIPTLDIIKKLSKDSSTKIVGFKADDDIENALIKKDNLNLDMMIWNKLETMNSNYFTGAIISKDGQIQLENIDKTLVAYQIAKLIKEKLA